jgi:hypothetical protein
MPGRKKPKSRQPRKIVDLFRGTKPKALWGGATKKEREEYKRLKKRIPIRKETIQLRLLVAKQFRQLISLSMKAESQQTPGSVRKIQEHIKRIKSNIKKVVKNFRALGYNKQADKIEQRTSTYLKYLENEVAEKKKHAELLLLMEQAKHPERN